MPTTAPTITGKNSLHQERRMNKKKKYTHGILIIWNVKMEDLAGVCKYDDCPGQQQVFFLQNGTQRGPHSQIKQDIHNVWNCTMLLLQQQSNSWMLHARSVKLKIIVSGDNQYTPTFGQNVPVDSCIFYERM